MSITVYRLIWTTIKFVLQFLS